MEVNLHTFLTLALGKDTTNFDESVTGNISEWEDLQRVILLAEGIGERRETVRK
jgi:hypothetical protein